MTPALMLVVLLALPLATAIACRLVPGRLASALLSAVGATGTLIAGLAVVARVSIGGPISLVGVFYVDQLSAVIVTVIVLLGFAASIYSIAYIDREVHAGTVPEGQVPWYYCGFHVFVWTMLLAVALDNLGLMWAAIEATTLVSAFLVGFQRTPAALEAAWKYLILCTVGIVIALFGVLLTYYASTQSLGPGAALEWTVLAPRAAQLDPRMMKLAFVFALIGFGTKAGLAPLHSWLPDAHSQAPAPISAMLSGVLLNCALYAILRFHMIASLALGNGFSSHLLLGAGLVSVAVAVPFILVQQDLKRLLAYSSVEHVGLIAVAVGLGGPLGLYAGLLHLLNHALAKGLLFLVAGSLAQHYESTRMKRIRGVLRAMPLTGALLLLGMFAITGVPPFALFVSEFGILGAGFARASWLAVAILIASLVMVFAGAFGHALDMAFGRPRAGRAPLTLAPLRLLSAAVPAAIVLAFGVYVPPAVGGALQQAAGLFGQAAN